MIKLLMERNGRPLVGFGLSRGNCKKLLEGRPIFIDLKVMMLDCDPAPDLNEATVLIFGGETEESMQDELRERMRLPTTEHIHEHYEEN